MLEIGAGTGRFTIPLARRCREVTAVELSENMTAVLKEHATRENLQHRYRTGDIESIGLTAGMTSSALFLLLNTYPTLTRFSKKYRVASNRAILYFTTAHRSLFRLFTQIGNAMRQGIWLVARTERSIYKSLTRMPDMEHKVSGKVAGIGADGSLTLVEKGGKKRSFWAGDVTFR